MKNLYKYLEKNGIAYEPQTFGSRYFYNVSIIYHGAFVSIDYRNGSARRKLENYLKRYGYTVTYTSRIYPDYSIHYTVCRTADHNAASLYYEYQNKSLAEWEEMQHREYSRGNYDINEAGKAIMTKYEKQYLDRIQEQQKKTA